MSQSKGIRQSSVTTTGIEFSDTDISVLITLVRFINETILRGACRDDEVAWRVWTI